MYPYGYDLTYRIRKKKNKIQLDEHLRIREMHIKGPIAGREENESEEKVQTNECLHLMVKDH